jgi:threonine dehydratase
MLQLSKEELSKGVVTHSSGNHAQAVAYMAKKLGVHAHVIMPNNANQMKVALAKKWGAEVVFCEPTIEDRIKVSTEIAERVGAQIVPPFDHPWIIEGQSTVAQEIMADWAACDTIVAPLGGGGLLAGSALAAHAFGNNTIVYGCEPAEAKDGYIGFKSGQRETEVRANTIADGLRTTVGAHPFEYIQSYVTDVFLAEERDIVPWMYRLWKEEKLVMEPSSAVPFAALDRQKDLVENKRIAIVVTGGNVDLAQLPSFTS